MVTVYTMERIPSLRICDLNGVLHLLEKYHFPACEHRRLGLALGLCATVLDMIEADHKKARRCLEEVLKRWLTEITDPSPCFKVLRDALKEINENSVASEIDKETCDAYDSSCDPDASNEEHAVNIFNLRKERGQLKCLNEPKTVADLLHKEGVLSDQDVTEVLDDVLESESRLQSLLIKIKIAIRKDHKALLNFARICIITGNKDLGNKILRDCAAAFKQSQANYKELCEVIGSCIKDVEKKAKQSVKYLSKLTSVLKQNFCITLSTVNDCMAVVRRETTMFNTTLLAEVAFELDCKSAKKKIDNFNSTISIKALCSVPSREPNYHATVETLSIAMSFDPERSVADIQHILSKLFGNLRDDVKWHGNNHEGIVCYFDPVYATLLIDKIIKGFSFCKEKQIQTITVGYCSVYDETLCDEAYKNLEKRIAEVEKRNLELVILNQKLDKNVKALKREINDLKEVNENLKKEAISLEDQLKEKESHIEELQSRLKEKLEMKDKIQRRTMQENEYLKSLLYETKNLEAMMHEKEKEIEILQDKVSLLSCQLLQNESYTQKEIKSLENENKALKTALIDAGLQKAEFEIHQGWLSIESERNIRIEEAQETTNQLTPMPQQQYDRPAENIFESETEITLTAPSLKTCKEIQIQQAVLSLNDAFVDSASAILLQLPESITYLHINRTPLSHDSVHSIIQLLQRLKALRLTDVSLPSTSLSYILNALLTNESLEKFTIRFNSQMILPLSSTSAASYAQAISDVVRRNSTLQYFSALGLRLDEAGVVKILLALAEDNSTLHLLTLDQSHQATAHRFAETNGPIKDRLSFSFI